MKKYPHPLLSIFLFFVGVILNCLIFICYTFWERTYTLFTDYQRFKKWCWHLDMTQTQRGNVYHEGFFNRLFWHQHGAKSGDPDESVSSVTGKNEWQERLDRPGFRWFKIGKYSFSLGQWLANILNKIQKNHSLNAREYDEGTKFDGNEYYLN